MSSAEEIPYNSGARLYRQVTKVVGKLQPDDPVFRGVAQSVNANVDSLEHFRAVLALRKLFSRTLQDIEDSSLNGEQKKRHIADVKNVQTAFRHDGLVAKWVHAQKQTLTSERIERLFYVGSALYGALGPNVILAAEIENITALLREVLQELESADLPKFAYDNLKKKIELLVFDLENSDLFGPEEVRDEIVAIVGETACSTSKEIRKKNDALFGNLGKALNKAIEWMNKSTATGRSIEYISDKSDDIIGMLSNLP